MTASAQPSHRLHHPILRLQQEISGLRQLEPLKGTPQYERLRLAELELKQHLSQQASQSPPGA